MTDVPRVADLPDLVPRWMLDAAVAGGAELVPLQAADTVVWGGGAVPPARLSQLLADHGERIGWVQLPWAGVEPYLDLLDDRLSGVRDLGHTLLDVLLTTVRTLELREGYLRILAVHLDSVEGVRMVLVVSVFLVVVIRGGLVVLGGFVGVGVIGGGVLVIVRCVFVVLGGAAPELHLVNLFGVFRLCGFDNLGGLRGLLLPLRLLCDDQRSGNCV